MPELPETLRLLRPRDLLVLNFEFINLRLTDDGLWLARVDTALPASILVRLPSQHVAERAYFETKTTQAPADKPPAGALAAAPSRLVFTVRDGQQVPFSVDGLLDWAALDPSLAPNALPPGTGVGPAPAPLTADQTAIEFPYRLLLSADASGRWAHRTQPFASGGRDELWHTRLAASTLRAVGRRSVPDTLRTGLSGPDLDDLVTLTSNFAIRPRSWLEMGIPPQVWMQRMQAAHLVGFTYLPRPLNVEQLLLTPLGAHARLRGHWDFPWADTDPKGPPPDDAVLHSFGIPTPSLEDYEHIAGLGRDQYVRVVRRGCVHAGMRASIVKVTERRFEPRQLRTEQTPNGPVGIFGATRYLRQYFKVVIQEDQIDVRRLAGGFAFGGREMPLRTLRLTTLETPKIDLPGDISPDDLEQVARTIYQITHPGQPVDEVAVARQAQQMLEQSLKEPFWIKVGGQPFEFGYVATDWAGRTIKGSLPPVFVPREAITDTAKVISVFSSGSLGWRRRSLANQKLALADPAGSAPGSTDIPTETLTFDLQPVPSARQASLPPTYRPRWVMAVGKADVHLESVERLTGSGSAVEMTFDPAYLNGGLTPAQNPAGVFARVAAQKVAFGGARGGGLARPDASVDRLSSRQGAMSSTFVKPSVSQAGLAALFGGAKLFGTVDLKDILQDLGALTADRFNAAELSEQALSDLLNDPTRLVEVPVLRTRPLLRDDQPYAVETRFVWKPRLRSTSLFTFRNGSELVLQARTVTPADGSEAQSEVRGELRTFGLRFFGVVSVEMRRLAFVSLPGRKPDVTAEGLDVTFEGPLQFVNSLQRILPANGFSDPPAIEVTPSGISAGYSLAVPTVGVGVFSLQNLALSAALSVPFIAKAAGLRFAISERHHPFLVTVTLFGGGGFFALGVSAKGVDEIEAAIEFGGNVALNLGVASGGVYVMAGIYFGRTGTTTTLTGYLRCGGYLSVLGLITISVEFYLAFTYRDKGEGHSEVWGQASVTVSVEVCGFSKSVRLSVERRFAGAGGDPALEDVVDADDWETYCLAFAEESP